MTRDPRQRADPATLLRGVRSVVSVAVAYGERVPAFEADGRFGRVARYAWGRDYHDVMLPRLAAFAADLARAVGGARTKVACDHSPLLERAAAARAGLGFLGKNSCLLLPRHGSWFLLGEVLLDADVDGSPRAPRARVARLRRLHALPRRVSRPARSSRRSCWTRDVASPTGRSNTAVRSRRRCARRSARGCSAATCARRCARTTASGRRPCGPSSPRAPAWARARVSPTRSRSRDDEAFARRFAGTPLLRPGREGLLRNAAIVARNVGAQAAVPALESCVRADPSAVVRHHALWALAGLAPAVRGPRPSGCARIPIRASQAEAEAVLSGAEAS